MGWLNFGGKKRDRAQGFGDSSKTKSRKRPKSFILEKIVTPSAGFGDWNHEFDHLHQLLGSLSLSDLHLPNFFADSGVCPIAPSAPTNNLPPLIDFDPLGLYNNGIATQTPYTPGGAFETLPIALIPVDPHSPNPNNPNAIRQLLNFPLASQPLVGTIDTGVSADSPYLNYANIKKGRDYVGGDDNPLLKPGEGSEHGTFMLGIIDAINKTAPKWVGRAIDSGRWADSLVEFVDAAKASGQKNAIANLSLDLTQKNADGSVTTRYELTTAERSAIEYARQNGVMLVVAAGNDGGVMSVLGQASQEFDNILTVGAADGKNRAAYSSFGRGLDILAEGGTPENPEWSTVGDGVGTMAGTSVATAKVTGAASLVWAANPDLSYRQVIEILEKTAKDLDTPGWDDETGFGLLDVLAAVEKAKQTTPEVYNPEDFLNLTTWSKEGQVTPEERAVQVHQVQNPSGRRYYYGWLNNSNRMDRFDFTVTSPKLLQFSLKDDVGSEFLEAQVYLYSANGNPIAVSQPDRNSSYRSVTLYPGNYHLHVDKGSRYEIDPYKLILNFNANNNISVLDESIWLPRPVIYQPPVFTNPGGSQVTVPVEPPVDWQKIAEEQAKAELLKKQQAEAAAKAAAEATAKAAAEAAAKAAAEAAQRRRLEAEENARKAITLAYIQNKSWLGNPLNGVQIDWNTLLNSRVAAIQYFDGGYVVWNGIHAVAYQTGSGNSSATNVTPVEVRLHDLGMQYGRKEYGQYVGFSKRQDYYKFTVENLGDSYPHDLLFALRSNGIDIPLTDATIEILDDQMKRVPLSQVWQPNGQPGLSHLNGTTYYVRVKPAKDNLNYGLTLNLDSAQESLGTARPLGAITGRRQFRDFVGNKGDGLGDYYSFSVEHPSLLHFSLSELDAGADANVELLDSNGNVVSLDSLSGKVGAKKLQPGSYYLRVNPANNTNTNYTLTMQMAEELGTYTGRHEYKDRIIAGKNREAYYRLNIDAPAEELHLSLKNLSADANVELLRDNGSGIVNSTLIFPVDGSTQSGTEAEYKGYANVQPGNYLVRVYLPNSSNQAAKYDLVMNLDQAGEDWSQTRDLGMLTDIAPLSDYQLSDFVGADKGDSGDVYKFQVGDYGLVHLALKPPAGDGEANMLAANMRLQDESGKDVTFLNANKNSGENYAAAYLQPGKSYYLTVIPTPGMMTNYNLVINPAQGGNDWASARDLGVIKDGQPNKADNDEDYKLQEFVGYLNGNVDGADFYKFTLYERNVMTFGLRGLSAPTHIQLFNAANPSKSIDFSTLVYETPNLDKRLKVELNKGTYYLQLSPDESLGKQGTTYSLGINAEKVKTVVNSNTNSKLGSHFADSRIQKIYDVAFTNVKTHKEKVAENTIAVLKKDRKAINQQITEQLALLNIKQRTKIENELDKVEKDGKDWVEKYIAKPIKDGIYIVAKNTIGVIDAAVSDKVEEGLNKIGLKDELKTAEETLKRNVETAQKWLEGKIDYIRGEIDKLIKEFVDNLKNAYKTGAEINGEIERLATTLKTNISVKVREMNEWVDEFKDQVTSPLKNLEYIRPPVGNWNFYKDVVENKANDLTEEIKKKVSEVGDIAHKTVNAVKSFAQGAVAEISSKLLGDDTGKLYNQIKGIDQQISNIRTDVTKAINTQAAVYKRLLDDFVRGLGEAGNFVIGALMGEFNDNPSIWQTLLDTAIGMIPIVGEIGDVRDLIAYTKKFIDNPSEMQDAWNWVGVVGSLVGLVPVAGGAIKGVTKVARNADFVTEMRKLGPTIVDAVVDFAKRTDWNSLATKSKNFYLKILDTVEGLLRKLNDGIRSFENLLPKLGILQPEYAGIGKLPDEGFFTDLANNVRQLRREAPKKIDEGFVFLKGKLDDLVASNSPKLIVGDSTKLGKNLYFANALIPGTSIKYPGVKGDYQAHHLIPVDVANNSDLIRKSYALGVFEIDSSINGIFLPKSEDVAIKLFEKTEIALPQHRGSHPQYSQKIQEIVDQKWQELKNKGKSEDPQSVANAIEYITNWIGQGFVQGYIVNDPTIKWLDF